MVEMVGGYTFHPTSGHSHGRIGFETCHSQKWNQTAGNVFTYTATVCIIHFRIVQGKPFSFSHRDSGIADIIGNPVG